MSIPQRFIIYRASRHEENFPVDIIHKCYSNKIHTTYNSKSKQYRNFYHLYQEKLVREISLDIGEKGLKNIRILQAFKKFRGTTRCKIEASGFYNCNEQRKSLATKVIQLLFRNLKSIKSLEFGNLGKLQKKFGIFKDLLLLHALQSLTFSSLKYSDKPKKLQSFLQAVQLASKNGYWPDLKSLKMKFSSVSRSNEPDPCQMFQALFEFFQNLKACERLYKKSSIQLSLPHKARKREEAVALSQLLKIAPCITRISGSHMDFLSHLPMFQHTKDLKSLSFGSYDETKQKPDLSALEDLKEINLLFLNYDVCVPFYIDIFMQVQKMRNLVSLKLDFDGRYNLMEDIKIDFCKALKVLSELKYLSLCFTDLRPNFGAGDGWMGDTFKIIGTKKKLIEFSLRFITFNFEDPRYHIDCLSNCLKKLTQLSVLNLDFVDIEDIETRDLRVLVQAISRLTKLRDLGFHISKLSPYFRADAFPYLITSISDNLPLLSRLDLSLEKIHVTPQIYQLIYQAIQKMKSLDYMALAIGGKIDKDLDLKVLEKEIQKRMGGGIYWDLYKW